jgi:uncharacterized SAM-binding protein YcdF (DUF218 family)
LKQNASPAAKKRLSQGLLFAGIFLVLLAVSFIVFHAQLLTGAADFLVVDSTPYQPADLIFVLNGDYDTRPFRAAELYQQGLAPEIVIARSQTRPAEKLGLVQNDTDISVQVMEKLGMPSGKIVILQTQGGVTSTFDEAVALRHYVAGRQVHRILLVTSAFHTRRARWIVNKELAGLPLTLEVAAVPYSGFAANDWWKSENGLIALTNAYVKLVYYYWKSR